MPCEQRPSRSANAALPHLAGQLSLHGMGSLPEYVLRPVGAVHGSASLAQLRSLASSFPGPLSSSTPKDKVGILGKFLLVVPGVSWTCSSSWHRTELQNMVKVGLLPGALSTLVHMNYCRWSSLLASGWRGAAPRSAAAVTWLGCRRCGRC